MTEHEWLNSDRVLTPLMDWLRRRGSSRKFYLAAAGWAQQVENKMTRRRCRALLPLVEEFADGLITAEELYRQMQVAKDDVFDRIAALSVQSVDGNLLAADRAAVCAATPTDGWIAAINALKDAGATGKRSEMNPIQIAVLRDIFGNPFRPASFDPNWRTSTVMALARGMYESRDFSTMPILSDALQDAGCESEDILNHCRGEGPHVRGCWVVDLVLGKE